MKRIFARGDLPRKFRASVVTIGIFDGVHRGHQKVIGRAVTLARRMHLPSVVVTFYPHPVEVLQPKKPFAYISSLERRLQLIGSLGVDVCVVVSFNKGFAAQPPSHFVQDLLVRQLGVKRLVLGSDFQFGCHREGSLGLLGELGKRNGFKVDVIKIINSKNINIKSSTIKDFILAGDLKMVKCLLGRRYDFLGEIEHGEARGRKLGYPTANFKKENVTILPSGIYTVTARCLNTRGSVLKKAWHGLCYVGRRPTFKVKDAPIVYELHLLDHNGYLYGRKVLMEFFRKEREDMTFSDERSLVEQIARDVRKARGFFHLL